MNRYSDWMIIFIFFLILVLISLLGIAANINKKQRARRKKHRRNQSEKKELYSIQTQKRDSLEKPENFDNIEKFELYDDREIEIKVSHVTMEFTKEKDEATSLKEFVIRTIKGQRHVQKFKALDDVSFTVKKGDVVGIIGTNGSGKSTILKIISGVLTPTSGSVQVDRSKIQLLTLGTGFDFELTGRENVYLNGAVIGYTKEFIDEKYDENCSVCRT